MARCRCRVGAPGSSTGSWIGVLGGRVVEGWSWCGSGRVERWSGDGCTARPVPRVRGHTWREDGVHGVDELTNEVTGGPVDEVAGVQGVGRMAELADGAGGGRGVVGLPGELDRGGAGVVVDGAVRRWDPRAGAAGPADPGRLPAGAGGVAGGLAVGGGAVGDGAHESAGERACTDLLRLARPWTTVHDEETGEAVGPMRDDGARHARREPVPGARRPEGERVVGAAGPAGVDHGRGLLRAVDRSRRAEDPAIRYHLSPVPQAVRAPAPGHPGRPSRDVHQLVAEVQSLDERSARTAPAARSGRAADADGILMRRGRSRKGGALA